jgi:hypothetical protein
MKVRPQFVDELFLAAVWHSSRGKEDNAIPKKVIIW